MGEYGAPYPELRAGLEAQPAQVIPAHQLQQVPQRQVLSRDPGHRLLAVQAQVTEPGHQVRVRGSATQEGSSAQGTYRQRKDTYSIEHRAGRAVRLASWRKMTQPGEYCW
jgi:hypothetical protein